MIDLFWHRFKLSFSLILLTINALILFVNNAGCIKKQIIKLYDTEESLGVKILSLRLSAEDHMIDLRYHVIDPEKAKPFFDNKIKPYLIDNKSGAKFLVPDFPKVGSLRQTPKVVQAGRNYFIIFANPGKFLKRGDKVSLIIGEFKIDGLVVEE